MELHSTYGPNYQAAHPTWLFHRHEDLSTNPMEQFKQIFDRLDLEFTPAVQNNFG